MRSQSQPQKVVFFPRYLQMNLLAWKLGSLLNLHSVVYCSDVRH